MWNSKTHILVLVFLFHFFSQCFFIKDLSRASVEKMKTIEKKIQTIRRKNKRIQESRRWLSPCLVLSKIETMMCCMRNDKSSHGPDDVGTICATCRSFPFLFWLSVFLLLSSFPFGETELNFHPAVLFLVLFLISPTPSYLPLSSTFRRSFSLRASNTLAWCFQKIHGFHLWTLWHL